MGIDYGSKLAGTTVASWNDGNVLCQAQSEKKKDADKFLLDLVAQVQPAAIFIDAPLSLPKVYSIAQEDGDYFYRKCDRELSAMSPMFLGGLTARAMRLVASFRKDGIKVFETYPAEAARLYDELESTYEKKKAVSKEIIEVLSDIILFDIPKEITNYHQIDSLLAWFSGYRFYMDLSLSYGSAEEGMIYI